MSDRPVAQVVVYGDNSPVGRETIRKRLTAMGAVVHEVTPHWIIGSLALPGSTPDDASLIARGIAFVEGRDRVEEAFGVRIIDETLRCLRDSRKIREIPGDVTLVRVDGNSAFLMRSCAGLGHWFVHRRPGSVMISTRLRFFEDLYDDEFATDELVLAASTAGSILPWNRTPLAAVTVLPPAHVAHIAIDGPLRFERYWNPADIELTSSLDRAEKFRTLFQSILDRDLSDTAPNMVTFSGGVDSSIVLSQSLALGRPVETVSLIPTLDYDDPLPTRRMINELLENAGVKGHWATEVDEHRWIDVQLSAPAIRVPMLNTTLIEAQRYGRERGAHVITGGEYADELFGGWNTLYDAWVPSLRFSSLVRSLVTSSELDRNRALRRWVSKRVRTDGVRPPFSTRLPAFIRADLHDEYADYIVDVRSAIQAERGPDAYVLGQLSHYTGWLLQNWEGCSEAGVRRSLPFYNREAIEFALSCAPEELAWPPKKLLRASFDGLVKSSHLHRIDKDAAGDSPRANVPFQFSIPIAPSVQALLDPSQISATAPIHPGVTARLAPILVAARRPTPNRLIQNHRRGEVLNHEN
jgi:hypothetical protein